MLSIEKALRLAADYHRFCDDELIAKQEQGEEELNEEDLEFVFAAANIPKDPNPDSRKKI